MYNEPPIDSETIVACLSEHWGLTTDHTSDERVGYGSWHWRATDDAARVWFVTADATDGPFPAAAAYELAHRLAEDGLAFVRGPQPSLAGNVVVPTSDWLVSLWRWIEGRAAEFGPHATAADLDATTSCLRLLHAHSRINPIPELIDDWSLSGRANLEAALAAPHGTGPYATAAAQLISNGASDIQTEIERYDELVAAAIAAEPPRVVTHGEPHAGNVIHTNDGAVLIDWDTAKWAPIERDLWHLVGYPDWKRGYGDVEVSDGLIELYRLNWKLSEIADFANQLLEARQQSPDHDIAMRELRSYLG